MQGYNLFLDDVRMPADCTSYMHRRIGTNNFKYIHEGWVIVRNYRDFVYTIEANGLPQLVSFDHDLAHEHYDPVMLDYPEKYETLYGTFKEKTGYEAGVWLKNYCIQFNLTLPLIFIHSMNPVGIANLTNLFLAKSK
jgi:hypothetical protein